MLEGVIRALNEKCVHSHRFETLQHVSRVIGDWIGFCNSQRPHNAFASSSGRNLTRHLLQFAHTFAQNLAAGRAKAFLLQKNSHPKVAIARRILVRN
jgi:hypothetical protein